MRFARSVPEPGSEVRGSGGAAERQHDRTRPHDDTTTQGLNLTENLRAASSVRPAIARIWRGRVRRERADEYEAYNYEAGIRPLIEKALGVQTFREDREHETEFVTVSYWESVEAMARFTGGDPRRVHHLDRDAEFLIELPSEVQTLRIRASHGDTGGEGR